jgi:hypothetical protein
MAGNAGGGNTSYRTVKSELIDAMKDSSFYQEKPQSEAVVDTTKETSSNNIRADVTTKVLSYPIARRNESATDYLSMEIARYTAPGLELPAFDEANPDLESFVSDFSLKTGSSQQVFKKDKTIEHIINLPIPRNITDTAGVQYGESRLNPIEAAGLAGASAAIQGEVSKIKEAFKNTFDTLGRNGLDENTQQGVAAALSGTAIGAFGGNVSADSVISRASGQILNPNLELLFQGVGLRVFPFQFQFFPRNSQEGKMVMKIIRTLKIAMAPSRTNSQGNANGVFIQAPRIFQLKYKKGRKDHPFLNKFLPTVLSDMKVNYSASGSYSSFYDGTPTHMTLDLQFKEINPLFKEDYDGTEGVGF